MMSKTGLPAQDEARGALAALWSLALARFRDYLQWAGELTAPKANQGGSHDLDR
jgi:hypothetical protein